jgi:hypothetical protein
MAKLTITQIDETQFWVLIKGNLFPIYTAKSYVGCLNYLNDYYTALRAWCCNIAKCRYQPIIVHSRATEAVNKLTQMYKVEYEANNVVLREADGKATTVIVQIQPYNTAESLFDLLTT